MFELFDVPFFGTSNTQPLRKSSTCNCINEASLLLASVFFVSVIVKKYFKMCCCILLHCIYFLFMYSLLSCVQLTLKVSTF
jgi:hypothetical protein